MNETDVSARPRVDWTTWWNTFSETADAVGAGVAAVRETLEGATRRTAEECYLSAFGQAMETVKFALLQLLTLRRELEGQAPDPVAELVEAFRATGHQVELYMHKDGAWSCESRLPLPYRSDPEWAAEAQKGHTYADSVAAALRARLEEVLELQLARAAAAEQARAAAADQVDAPEVADDGAPPGSSADPSKEIPF